MNEKYERYNEITFQAYCIQSINRAVARGVRQKERRAQVEVSLSELQERGELTLADALPDPAQIDFASDYFEVGSMTIPVIDHALACALRSITPDRRLIVLLSYLLDESDAEIAKELDLPKATVQDRRQKALKRLKELLESTP